MQRLFRPFQLLRKALASGFAAAVLLGLFSPQTLSSPLSKDQIKAAFLFNFAAFARWPDTLFINTNSPLRYCVKNAPEVAATLKQLVAGETLEGRPLALSVIQQHEQAKGCHLLYVGETTNIDNQLRQYQQNGLLLVGNSEQFINQGGLIALVTKRRRIHPLINLTALDASPLRLSSKLLRLATLKRPTAHE